MEPWKAALIYAMPGLVLDAIAISEYLRGRWDGDPVKLAFWLIVILLTGPFMLMGLAYYLHRR